MTRIVCWLSIVLSFAIAASTRAQDARPTAAESFAAGTGAYAEEDYLRALSHFQDARDAGLDSAAVHYNIAVCHYRLADYESAQSTFSFVADRFAPMRALAQYNLGLVAQKQGEHEAAAAYFRQALSNTQDEKVRSLAAEKLNLRPVAESARWYRSLTTRVGHDDNVMLVSDEVPLPSGQSADSASTEVWGLISGPLSTAPGFRFDGSLYSVRYQDASFYDQDYLRVGAAYRWRSGKWSAEAGPQLSHATLDGEGYEQRTGAALSFRRGINARLAFRAGFVHDEIDAGDARFAFTEGSRDWVELSLERGDAQRRLIVSYATESNDRGANIASTRHKLAVRYRYSFNERWLADVSGSLRRSSYDDLAQPRDEDLSEVSLGITRHVSRKWEINGAMSTYRNAAVEPFAYDRSRISIAVNRLFF